MTDVAASLPDLILPPGATITVTFDDASTVITQLNVFGFTPVKDAPVVEQPVPPMFAYEAAN